MGYEIRLSRAEDHPFVRKPGTLDVVPDREMLVKPALYGWNMDKPVLKLKLEDYESVPDFEPVVPRKVGVIRQR